MALVCILVALLLVAPQPPQHDTRPPTAPGKLTALRVTSTGVTLTWHASTGNAGVVAYDVYMGQSLVRSVAEPTAVVADLVAGTTYTFTVRARDSAGNVSRASNRASATVGMVRPPDFTVWGFSQSDVDGEDPQVYQFVPDVNIRAIGKWSTNGDEAEDYNFAQINRYHEKGITFIGSGTTSVIFPHDFPTPEIFDDMSTRDADGNPVPHDEFGFPIPARRGNMFNPRYREYLLGWAKLQIDGGVDGLSFDEVNAGFSGGLKWGFNGNEGFDDYALADFNRYLLAKYPAFTDADWRSRFGMTDDNIVRRDVPPSDLDRNFNYRDYLRANGWNTNPVNATNPLAPEWGRVIPNRMYADDMSFTATYLRRYWKQMVDELRAYAWHTVPYGRGRLASAPCAPRPAAAPCGLLSHPTGRAGRQILITSNGLLPYVDFNGVGMYPWNADEQTPDGRGADYVPVVNGHLNGAKSLQANYRYLKEKSRQIAGRNVPVVVFIDWPNDMMTNYLNLPLQEKKDYWQIFGAEAYANGIFPAFHLKDTVGSPTAEQLGMLGFYGTYSRFYREHANLFRHNDIASAGLRLSAGNVSASLLVQRGTGARTLHLVNHNYNLGIVPQTGFTAEVDLPSCPRGPITMVSPDFAGSKTPESSCRHGRLTLTIDRLDYYNVMSIG
ncbi:fibronectin type III domain-containing protein [Allorhizocola rhizosphaerae]|uniref:fibronectin type III domain-containing protein n=1 Tax=Allorhizocola rhizosphaerae TaxID=1872709 RepID=UPI001B8C3AA4|nr:fibronectin type III domain-containing protein [Allorhizocola rhizosphaerae]